MQQTLKYNCFLWQCSICFLFFGILGLAGCASAPHQPTPQQPNVQCEPNVPINPALPCAPIVPVASMAPHLQAVTWSDLPGWQLDTQYASWQAWLNSCTALQHKPIWQSVCHAAAQLNPIDDEQVRAYFEANFDVYQSLQADGTNHGLMTGYYAPVLQGSRFKTGDFTVPLYAVPPDLLTVDLSALYPELKHFRLRGRVVGHTVEPYFSRAQIDGNTNPLVGDELVWVADPVDAFFMQIQGSGYVNLPDGQQILLAYADQNGYPYAAIGRVLVDQGELRADQVSMQAIRAWGAAHPDKLPALLAKNPSYVFFKTEVNHPPVGALGVNLQAGRSVAIDPRAIPLGAPIWLSTTAPMSNQAMNRLVMAQDTGGAIRGNVRADVYFGVGDDAGAQAGKMKQTGQLWVLWPKGIPAP